MVISNDRYYFLPRTLVDYMLPIYFY